MVVSFAIDIGIDLPLNFTVMLTFSLLSPSVLLIFFSLFDLLAVRNTFGFNWEFGKFKGLLNDFNNLKSLLYLPCCHVLHSVIIIVFILSCH